MADLSGLKKRVELIDLRLKTAHNARERESAALMEIWEQIKERFVDQNTEITRLRDRVADLEDARDELLGMVHGLLSAVEGGLERMSDETVPHIKVMAHKLLAEHSESSREQIPPPHAYPEEPEVDHEDEFVGMAEISSGVELENANFHRDLLGMIEQSLEDVEENISYEVADIADEPVRSQRGPIQHVKEPASPGIRNLIARIEGAVGPNLIEMSAQSGNDDETDDELTRDLRDIEALRGELHGLRERISSGAR